MILNFIFMIFLFFLISFNILNQQYFNHEKKKKIILQGKTMGTYWQIKIPHVDNKFYLKNLIQKTLDKDEEMLSSWKKNSIIYQFNQLKKNKILNINKNLLKIILISLKINKKTYGKLDITIGKLINMWGFGNKKKPYNYPSIKKIQKNISLTGIQHLKITSNSMGNYIQKDINGIEINLSTLGEGFAVDHIASILKKKKIKDYIVSVGGAIKVYIKKEDQDKIIAIQKPTDKKKSIHLLIHLRNQSISTAGTYRNYYYLKEKKISHLIDPTTGMPTKSDLVSVSVISSTALEADGWDTGLLLLGFKKAKTLALKEKLAVCLINQKNNSLFTWTSPEFKKFILRTKNVY
ncbi:FAD:protein FMN transferase [Buchnera aphidicola (Hyalopterus amygdali)]